MSNQKEQLIHNTYNQALELYQLQKFQDAANVIEQILKHAPNHAPSYLLLGKIHSSVKNYDKAYKIILHAQKLNPNLKGIHMHLGGALFLLGEYKQAAAEFETARKTNKDGHILTTLGICCQYLGEEEKAEECFRKGYEENPREIYYLCKYLEYYHKIKSKDDPLFQKLLKAEKTVEGQNHDRKVVYWRTMFKAYDGLGEHQKAFECARKMKEQYRAHMEKLWSRSYDDIMNEFIGGLEENKIRYTAQTIATVKPEDMEQSDKAVFVLGLPRSGTTLVEQILCAHPHIKSIGEDETLHRLAEHYKTGFNAGDAMPENIKDLAAQYIAHLEKQHSGAARVVNKAISDFSHAGFIAAAFPNAAIIHVQRDPRDCAISGYTRPFEHLSQPQTYDLKTMARHYLAYKDLMAHWNALFPGRILNVQYEDIVEDLESNAKAMISHAGLEWDNNCLEFYNNKDTVVRTASTDQVRKPIYTSSLARWKPYEAELSEFIEAIKN